MFEPFASRVCVVEVAADCAAHEVADADPLVVVLPRSNARRMETRSSSAEGCAPYAVSTASRISAEMDCPVRAATASSSRVSSAVREIWVRSKM